MMAGPVSDTIGHSNGEGEIVRVSPQASKARQVDAKKARKPAVTKKTDDPDRPETGKIANALASPRGGQPDKLTRIKGIGPVIERKLNEHGIFHFDQIAAWKKADVKMVETYLAFPGRIERDGWIGQAKALMKAAGTGGRK
jgi:branched-chain amino acid transport system ATP-binding protein